MVNNATSLADQNISMGFLAFLEQNKEIASNVTHLKLTKKYNDSEFPKVISYFPKLEGLQFHVASTQSTYSLFDEHLEKVDLKNLKSLDLTNCWGVTDDGIQILEKTTRLTTLILKSCLSLTNESLPTLAKCPLAFLHLTGNVQLTDNDLQTLIPLANTLTTLQVHCSGKMTSEGFNAFSQFTNLTSLKVNYHSLEAENILSLSNLPLTSLDLIDSAYLNPEGLENLTLLAPTLTELHIRCAEMTMDEFSVISQFIILTTLEMGIGYFDFKGIKTLPKLVDLGVTFDKRNIAEFHELNTLTKLSSLSLGSWGAIPFTLAHVNKLENLTKLDLHLNVKEEEFSNILSLKKLEILNLYNQSNLRGTFLKQIPQLLCIKEISFQVWKIRKNKIITNSIDKNIIKEFKSLNPTIRVTAKKVKFETMLMNTVIRKKKPASPL